MIVHEQSQHHDPRKRKKISLKIHIASQRGLFQGGLR